MLRVVADIIEMCAFNFERCGITVVIIIIAFLRVIMIDILFVNFVVNNCEAFMSNVLQ